MKTIVSLSLIALLSLSLAVACSSGSSGPSCEDVCNKMVECDPLENYTECVSSCDEFEDVMRDGAYEALGNCYMDNTCVFLEANGEYCLEAAIAQGSLPASLSLIEQICTKFVSCDTGAYTQQQCIDDMTGADEGIDMYHYMSMFSDSVLDCIGTCVDGADCGALADDGPMICFDECGLGFIEGSDDETDNPGQ